MLFLVWSTDRESPLGLRSGSFLKWPIKQIALTDDRRQRSDALLVAAEEVVVGCVRHERLLTHIAWHSATGTGGSPSLRVQTLDVRGLGQEVTAGWSRVCPD